MGGDAGAPPRAPSLDDGHHSRPEDTHRHRHHQQQQQQQQSQKQQEQRQEQHGGKGRAASTVEFHSPTSGGGILAGVAAGETGGAGLLSVPESPPPPWRQASTSPKFPSWQEAHAHGDLGNDVDGGGVTARHEMGGQGHEGWEDRFEDGEDFEQGGEVLHEGIVMSGGSRHRVSGWSGGARPLGGAWSGGGKHRGGVLGGGARSSDRGDGPPSTMGMGRDEAFEPSLDFLEKAIGRMSLATPCAPFGGGAKGGKDEEEEAEGKKDREGDGSILSFSNSGMGAGHGEHNMPARGKGLVTRPKSPNSGGR